MYDLSVNSVLRFSVLHWDIVLFRPPAVAHQRGPPDGDTAGLAERLQRRRMVAEVGLTGIPRKHGYD